jgi:hypothetical protein
MAIEAAGAGDGAGTGAGAGTGTDGVPLAETGPAPSNAAPTSVAPMARALRNLRMLIVMFSLVWSSAITITRDIGWAVGPLKAAPHRPIGAIAGTFLR